MASYVAARCFRVLVRQYSTDDVQFHIDLTDEGFYYTNVERYASYFANTNNE